MPDTGQYNQFPIDWRKISASKVPYSNATSGLSATDVQGAIDELNTDLNAIDASDIPYDNTASGLTADDVQEALDELASEKQDTLTAGDGIDITSNVISVETDSALTSATLPANAKAVGDALSAQETATEEALYTKAPVITDTASGSIATFPDGADGYPLKECVVNIEAVQSGSGDPSPTNVRPISGWSSAKVTRTGRNLCPMTATSGSGTNGLSITVNADKTFYATKTESAWGLITLGTILLKAGSYKIYEDSDNNTNAALNVMDGETNIVNTRYTKNGASFTITADTEVTITYSRAYATTSPVLVKAMIYPASDTDTTYEPYNGTSITIDLDGTRYGGTLNVTRGKLTVTHAYKVLNGTETWYAITSPANGFRNSGSTDFPGRKSGGEFICNRLYDKGNSLSDLTNTWDAVWASNLNVRTDNLFATIEDWQAWVAQNNLECVYELNSPIEVDLTPTEITTLLGTNNLWSDTGDVEVEYCCSTKLFIEKKLAELMA